MAKNIKFLYKKHISDTAPDMEKLWDRIEGQLENKTDKDQTRIKVSRRNYRKFAAAAASLVLIIGGVSLYADIRSESDSVSKHSVETADKARLENREEKTYEQLSFSHTDTKAETEKKRHTNSSVSATQTQRLMRTATFQRAMIISQRTAFWKIQTSLQM